MESTIFIPLVTYIPFVVFTHFFLPVHYRETDKSLEVLASSGTQSSCYESTCTQVMRAE